MYIAILIINCFFVPVISPYILSKIRKTESVFSFKFVLQYILSAIAVSVVCKVLFLLWRIVSGLRVELDSIFYTAVAVIVSVLIPCVYELLKKYTGCRIEACERYKSEVPSENVEDEVKIKE